MDKKGTGNKKLDLVAAIIAYAIGTLMLVALIIAILAFIGWLIVPPLSILVRLFNPSADVYFIHGVALVFLVRILGFVGNSSNSNK